MTNFPLKSVWIPCQMYSFVIIVLRISNLAPSFIANQIRRNLGKIWSGDQFPTKCTYCVVLFFSDSASFTRRKDNIYKGRCWRIFHDKTCESLVTCTVFFSCCDLVLLRIKIFYIFQKIKKLSRRVLRTNRLLTLHSFYFCVHIFAVEFVLFQWTFHRNLGKILIFTSDSYLLYSFVSECFTIKSFLKCFFFLVLFLVIFVAMIWWSTDIKSYVIVQCFTTVFILEKVSLLQWDLGKVLII